MLTFFLTLGFWLSWNSVGCLEFRDSLASLIPSGIINPKPAERKKLLLGPRERLQGQLEALNAYAGYQMLHATLGWGCCVGVWCGLLIGTRH